MLKYLSKRLLVTLVVLVGITVIDFALMSLAGNPIEMLSGGPRVQEAVLQQKAQNLGLDQPMYIQYWNWLGAVIHGDFGYSYANYQSVARQISSHLGPTLILMGTALGLSLVIAVAGGVYSAVHQHSKRDYVIVSLAFLGQSVPAFFLGLMAIHLFTVRLGLLPSGGMRLLGSPGSGVQFKYLLMPSVVLAFGMAGRNIRYFRAAVLEILNKDYLRTATAKGIGRRKVIWHHALRNALIPIITVIGMELPGLFGGAVIIEEVFSWPGLGLLTMNAILARDYPVIMAVCLLTAVVVLLGNLLIDILYAVVDPSIRYT